MKPKIAFVRSNMPQPEPRARMMLEAQKHMNSSAILWDRTGTDTETKEDGWSVYHKESPFGIGILLMLPLWWHFVFWELIKQRPTIVHACNVDSAIPAAMYCVLFRKKLLYDIWDTSGGMLANNSIALTKICNIIDKILISLSTKTFVPDSERLDQLQIHPDSALRNKVRVIVNSVSFTPWKSRSFTGKSHSRPIRLIYSGVLSKSIRGLEWLIESVSKNTSYTLDVIGYGADTEYIEELCANAGSTVTFRGKLANTQVADAYAQSDIVVSLLDPTFANYAFATSTKVFEAFAYGLPVITTIDTATGRLVEKYAWGYTIAFTKDSLNTLLETIPHDTTPIVLNPKKVEALDGKRQIAAVSEVYSTL